MSNSAMHKEEPKLNELKTDEESKQRQFPNVVPLLHQTSPNLRDGMSSDRRNGDKPASDLFESEKHITGSS